MNDNDSHYRWQGEKLGSRLLPLLVLMMVASTACSDAAEDPGLRVVATTTVLGDVAANVVGSAGSVEVLLPIGADPHGYQASARQVAALREADLVIANGLGLEEGLHDVLESAAADGATILEAATLIDPIPFGMDGPDEHDDGHGEFDPHIWLDPLRMADVALGIAAALEESHPGDGWIERAGAYAAELAEADRQIIEILSAVPDGSRKLVTAHEALGYFADRYGFEVVGTVIPGGSTLADPSSAELAELVAVVQAEGVRAIFAETTDPTSLVNAVAAELGEEIAVVDLHTGSLGGPGSGAETLIEMLTSNALAVAAALE